MADDRFPQQQPVPSGEHLYIIPKTGKHYEFPFFLYGIETLIASLNDNYINNFIYDFFMFFFMISLCRKIMGHFQIYYLMIFLWLNLCFFYDEIYDLVSLGFEEEKSRKTQKKIFKKKSLKKHKKNHETIIKISLKKNMIYIYIYNF
jgi:hypothetical protein